MCLHLVASIMADVVVLVLLEEVAGPHGVAVVEEPLVAGVEGGALQQNPQQLQQHQHRSQHVNNLGKDGW